MPVPGNLPQSGVDGDVVFGTGLAAITLAADSWAWGGNTHVIPAPSFPGRQYMEFAVGKSSLILTFTGTWNALANPFASGLKQGGRGRAVFLINSVQFAIATDAIIQSWDVINVANATCSYKCTLIADWRFNDFSNTPAAGY